MITPVVWTFNAVNLVDRAADYSASIVICHAFLVGVFDVTSLRF